MDIKALQRRLRDFATARDWQPYHAPKNLAMALMVEAAELMEHFQWSTLPESRGLTRDPTKKEAIADEIADVLLYLLQLADHTDVNIEEAVEAKLRKNAIKHPSKRPELPAPSVAAASPERPRVHLLVDWENVQPDGKALLALVPHATDVWLLHGPSQEVETSSHVQCFGGEQVTLVPRAGTGKNALDFQLCFYTGYLSSSKKGDEFVVIANDKGYDAMVEHARLLKFSVSRVGYQKKAVAQLPSVAPVDRPSAAQIAWRLIVHRRKSKARNQAWEQKDMHAKALDWIPEGALGREALAAQACGLAQRRLGQLGLDRVACPALATAAEIAAERASPVVPKKTAKKRSMGEASLAANNGTAAPKMAPAACSVYAKRVVASLQKMQANLPSTQGALLKTIQAHIGKQAEAPELAQQVLVELIRRQDLQCLPDGKSVRFPRLVAESKQVVQPSAAKKKTASKKAVAHPVARPRPATGKKALAEAVPTKTTAKSPAKTIKKRAAGAP